MSQPWFPPAGALRGVLPLEREFDELLAGIGRLLDDPYLRYLANRVRESEGIFTNSYTSPPHIVGEGLIYKPHTGEQNG